MNSDKTLFTAAFARRFAELCRGRHAAPDGSRKALFFSSTPSLIEITTSLWTHGDVPIAIITALFPLVFPLAKLAVLHVAAFPATSGVVALPSWFKVIARWSILDVLVVALVIFAAKTSGLASAAAKPGLWFFTLSVALTALASASVARRER